jgi:hypothetical protein
MSENKWASVGLAIAVVMMVLGWLFISSIRPAHARDLGQWGDVDPAISAWYMSLKQPGTNVSCCGPGDSYYCDEHSRGSQVYCIVDDDRDDVALKRTHVDNGTEINIPQDRLNKDANKIGRAIVFLGGGEFVWCFIGAGGF